MVKRRTLQITLLNLKIVHELFINKKGITIKKLSENVKTDYKNTYNAVDFLFKNGIIRKEKIGNYNVCSLNYDNKRDIVGYLKFHNFVAKNDFKKKHNVEYQIIVDTISELRSKIHPFFICLVFGSYAKNEEKKGSDIDILFLTLLSKQETTIKNILNKINAPYQKKFHIIEQGMMEFIQDFRNKDKLSIAIEVYKEPPIIFYGEDIFLITILDNRE